MKCIMNFRQVPLSLSSLFSFTVFISISILASYSFAPISNSFCWHYITGPHFCNFQSRPYPQQTFLPSSSSCHLSFPSPSVSLSLPGPQTAVAASHSNENGGEVEAPKTRSFSADYLNSNSLLSVCLFPEILRRSTSVSSKLLPNLFPPM